MTESASLRTLASQRGDGAGVRLLIWDNSPTSVGDPSVIESLSKRFDVVDYVHTPENTPLSILYNSAIAADPASMYLILDQDSELPPTLLDTLAGAASSHPEIMLFVPKVVANGQIVSPGRFGQMRGRQISQIEPGIHPTRGITVITSGLALRGELFSSTDLRFNEALWLYAIDTDFFLRFRERFSSFCLLDDTIGHDSALRGDLALDQRLFRFRNLRWSYLMMMRGQHRSVGLAYLYMAVASLRRALQYRSFRFLLGWRRSN